MELRLSTLGEIPLIMEIIKDAQAYLASLKIDQWQDGYPNIPQIEVDIKNNDSYIVVNEKNKIIGTNVFSTKRDSTYDDIDGEWITSDNAQYGVIHRLAVGNQFRKKGLGDFVFTTCENQLKERNIKSMRIDTHKDNLGMQHMLKQRGYIYCGIISITSGDERLAYEKEIG
jgi:ribosomal protein S18 acetylase RimI-like enzyme